MKTYICRFFSLLIFASINLMAASVTEDKSNGQETDFQAYVASVGERVYRTINQNVTFAPKNATKSPHWETVLILNNPVFYKKPGVPLSVALESLLDEASSTQFECTTAQTVFIWHVLLKPELGTEEFIQSLEDNSKDFRLPLITSGIVQIFMDHAKYYGFSMRKGPFILGTTQVDIEEEWSKLTTLKKNHDRISRLYSTQDLARGLMKDSPEGALSYLSNVPGIKGVAKGENILSLGRGGLYYGFGPTFKDGPQTLQVIGEKLKQSISLADYDAYITDSLIKRAEKLHVHPLQLLITSIAGTQLDQVAIMKNAVKCGNCGLPGAALKCGACKKVPYCSKECQRKQWPTHKQSCTK